MRIVVKIGTSTLAHQGVPVGLDIQRPLGQGLLRRSPGGVGPFLPVGIVHRGGLMIQYRVVDGFHPVQIGGGGFSDFHDKSSFMIR